MKKILTIAAMASIVLVGCQKNETADVTPAGSGYVSFDAYAGKTTRATLTTNANFDVFNVYGYQGAETAAIDWTNPIGLMTDLAVTKVENSWSTESPIKWPAVGTKTQFFAYSPKVAATYSVAESKPQLAFIATNVVAEQKDLVVAESAVIDAPTAGNGNAVALNFSHALSKVSTKVNVSSGLKVHIESIEMCNLGSVASYSFNPAGADAWGNATIPKAYGITLANSAIDGITSGAEYTAITAVDGAALVIPQTTTKWTKGEGADSKFTTSTKSYVKISYKMVNTSNDSYIVGDASTHQTAYFPVAFDFGANKAYNLNFMFGNAGGPSSGGGYDDNGDPIIDVTGLISFTVSLTDWETTIDNGVEL